MKKQMTLLLCLFLLLSLACPAFALDLGPGPVVDDAQLLTTAEEEDLRQKAAEIYDSQGIWVTVLTVNKLNGKSAQAYADDFYDNNYYRGHPNGVLFLIAMETREWHISTCGTAIDLLTDDELDGIFYRMADHLSDHRFYDAFAVYLDLIPQYLQEAPQTEPGFGDFVRILLISLLIGAAAGGVTIWVMRGQMNTAKAQHSAGNYLIDGSFQLKKHLDIFLYSKVSRTRKAQSSSGSSSHRSSGGVSHGGRGGRF